MFHPVLTISFRLFWARARTGTSRMARVRRMRFMTCFVLFSAQNYAHASCITILIGEWALFLGEWAKNGRTTDSRPPATRFRQTAAHQHPLEGPEWPLNVRQGPISACGAPQPAAQRAERLLPCGSLAKLRADWRNSGQISPLGRNDKGQGSVEMAREKIPGRAGNDGRHRWSKGPKA